MKRLKIEVFTNVAFKNCGVLIMERLPNDLSSTLNNEKKHTTKQTARTLQLNYRYSLFNKINIYNCLEVL